MKKMRITAKISRGENMFARKQYLNQLVAKRDNGRVKIITGMRRSGKSVLLFQLYKDYLLSEGVKESSIITLPATTSTIPATSWPGSTPWFWRRRWGCTGEAGRKTNNGDAK